MVSLRCAHCDHAVVAIDAFCSACGRPLGTTPDGDRSAVAALPVTPPVQVEAERRRLGGTPWSPPPTVDRATSEATPVRTEAAIASPARRRRRRPRSRLRRPIVFLPLTLVVLLGLAAGVVAYQAESTISRLQEVSTPAPEVSDNTQDADSAQQAVVIDTGPAQKAVQEAVAAGELDAPANSGDGDLFGRVRDAADNTTDLADGAAVAAGVKDGPTAALTILVMGVDARPGSPIDIAVRPDALMVLRLDPTTGTCRGLAIPRDTLVDLPGYGTSRADLLSSPRFRELLTDIGKSVDIVIIDTPPVLAVTDPLVVATNTSAVMVVCRAGRTRIDVLRRVVDRLHQGNVRIAGIVLNQQTGRDASNYYYYYSGYYGDGDGDANAMKAKKAVDTVSPPSAKTQRPSARSRG